jgi:hypothetical protein
MPQGRREGVVIATNGSRLGLACINGQWHAMNFRSSCPTQLRNRSERSTWAHLIGVPAKDVEAYVRRKKREKQNAIDADQLEHAKAIMRANGYEVIE